MVLLLPPDIILLICEELANQREFVTLFNCAISSRYLAGSALLWMYRIHNQAMISGGESNEAEMTKSGAARVTQAKLIVKKWALQWRSIIMSSMAKTAYPYCLYIRSLDLSNLEELLDDTIFRDFVAGQFFENVMKALNQRPDIGVYTHGSWLRGDKAAFLNLVGDFVSKFVGESAATHGGAAALQELSGPLEQDALSRWIGHLSRLRSIRLWHGGILDKKVADIIAVRCLDFDSLSIYLCSGPEADAKLASFLGSLRRNTLRFLQVISHNGIKGQTFIALTHHSKSLRDLRIGDLNAPAMRALSQLRPCTAIQNLELQDGGTMIDLEATKNDTFLEVIAWLTSCKQLKTISLKNFTNGPAFLASVCLDNDIHLESLSLYKYPLINNQELHRALAHQTNIKSLDLTANAGGAFRDDIDVLVTSLCSMTNLKYLNLLDTSDYFNAENVQSITDKLTELEDLSIAGYGIDDKIWTPISKLQNLRSLSFHAITTFTCPAILDYISTLRPTNAGLQLSVMCAAVELTASEQRRIRDALTEKADGKFDFVTFREVESEFDSDSD